MTRSPAPGSRIVVLSIPLALAGAIIVASSQGYERYNDGCHACHGEFTGPQSPAGSIFPQDSKHEMHRGSASMDADCGLCHTGGPGSQNPFIGSSDGTANNPGVGCTGCHGRDYGGSIGSSGVGLRRHHANFGITLCGQCHPNDPEPLPEDVVPIYYGTPDTNAGDPCNAGPQFAESWSLDDDDGLDNDGDLVYDQMDWDCADCVGDTNGDTVVDVQDLANVILDWGTDGADNNGDIDGSGTVDVEDITAVILAWGVCE